MSEVHIFKCDLCMREHRPSKFWWDNAHGGDFTVRRDGINGGYSWKNLCPTCREVLCEAVDKVRDTRKPRPVPHD